MLIKDNTPMIKTSKYSSVKADCEFCGSRHSSKDDMCQIKTDQWSDGNSMDNGAKDIKLKDLYASIKH